MKRLGKIVAVGVTIGMAVVLVGCQSAPKMGRYNIEFALDDTLIKNQPSITVDVVGPIGQAEESRWNGMDLDEYWKPMSDTRRDNSAAVRTFKFGPGDTATKTLPESDPIWDKWEGSSKIVVVTSQREKGTGTTDARRAIIDRDTKVWPSKTIHVVVQQSQTRVEMPPAPPKR